MDLTVPPLEIYPIDMPMLVHRMHAKDILIVIEVFSHEKNKQQNSTKVHTIQSYQKKKRRAGQLQPTMKSY